MKSKLSYELNNKDPEDKKRFIRNLFDDIVPTYDLLNHMLSFGTDKLWRRRIFRHVRPAKERRALDLCCGTGDLSLLLHRHGANTVSLDFSLNMLGRGKARNALPGNCVAADASRLPFADASFGLATIAFGIRNIPDLNIFIDEVNRVFNEQDSAINDTIGSYQKALSSTDDIVSSIENIDLSIDTLNNENSFCQKK
jgi:demethylmenaquinone methyltransferase/2-methoxy-6-polyprenyl-1,4-benzoquinol methylase